MTYNTELMLSEVDCEVCGVEYAKLVFSETENGFKLAVVYSDSIDTMRATEQSKQADVDAVLADARNTVESGWSYSHDEENEDDVLASVYVKHSSEQKRELNDEINSIVERIKNR